MKLLNPLRVVTLSLLLTKAPFLLAQDEEPAAEPRIPAESGQVTADIDGSTPGLRA